MTRIVVAVVVVTMAVAAAGCGSKKSSSSAGSEQTTTTSSSSSSSGGGAKPSFASAKNCKDLEQMAAKLGQAVAGAGGQGGNVTDISKAYSQLADAAPSEIRGDLQTLAGVFQKYAEAIAKSGYKPGTTPTAAQIAAIQNVAKTFDDPKLKTAETHLTAWAQSNCAGVAGNG